MNQNSSPQLPDEYLREIGEVCVLWSALEITLEWCLGILLGIEARGPRPTILFNHMSFPQKMNVFSSSISYLLPKHPHLTHLNNYKEVLQELREANEKRNKIIHAHWNIDENTGEILRARLSARGELKIEMEPYPISHLQGAQEMIRKAARDLVQMIVFMRNNPTK